jgi:HAD superfamily hydrolase (TIGR01450 family)
LSGDNDLQEITFDRLIERYAVLLLDAYGVLVHTSGALNGAAELISGLNRIKKPYFILTNDASRLPQTGAARFKKYGLEIEPDRIITSGQLIEGYFKTHHLEGARCVVLGPEDSTRYVKLAGGQVVSPDEAFEVLVICDEGGFPFIETVDKVLSALFHKFNDREEVHLLLPNPDLIYPKSDQDFGITSGSIALVLEAALRMRYPDRSDLRFTRLGKPHAAIFQEAFRRSGTRDVVMVGDQLETDIRGAKEMGIDSVLVSTGVTQTHETRIPEALRPTYLLHSLSLSRSGRTLSGRGINDKI